MPLHGRVPVGENELAVGSVVISTSGDEQMVKAKTKIIIPARSVVIVPGTVELLPETTNFILESGPACRFIRGQRFILPVAKSIFRAEQYHVSRSKLSTVLILKLLLKWDQN